MEELGRAVGYVGAIPMCMGVFGLIWTLGTGLIDDAAPFAYLFGAGLPLFCVGWVLLGLSRRKRG